MPESPLTARLAKLRQRRTAPLILELDLTDGISETRPADPVAAIAARNRVVLPDVLDGLRRARDDDRVAVLVARLGGRGIGLAAVQELRRAVAEFAEAGKTTIAWAESFGEFSASNVQYYLATAFEKIWLQPSGDLGLTGIAVERIFLRGALDKLGADFQVAKRHEYKSAAEQLTETGFSPAAREETDRMTASVTEQLVQGIADRRGLSREKVGELIDAGPFLAGRAQSEGLIDQLGYRDEVYAEARKLAGPDAVVLYLSRYQRAKAMAQRARATVTRLPGTTEPGVALIYATGAIRRGRSGRGLLPAGGAMGSDTIAAAIRTAARDEHIRAILLRVNSPGGSYVASDTIWREVVRAQRRRNSGRGVDGRRRGVGRLLHLDGRRPDRRAAGHDYRLDRRAHRKAGTRRCARPRGHQQRPDHSRCSTQRCSPSSGRSPRTSGRLSATGWITSTPTSPARLPAGAA